MNADTPRSLILKIEGLGHVPSKKNSKMWTGRKLITKPEYQEVLKKIIQSFRSQLAYEFRIEDAATVMEPCRQSSIVSLQRCAKNFDDALSWLPKLTIEVEWVEKGQEGAVIEIQKL